MVHRRSGYPGLASLVLGLGLAAGADLAPLDGRFETHMVQHLLVGDVGPLFVVLGLSGRLRPAHPCVALPVWAAAAIGWHLRPLYDAALAHGWVHQAEHLSFFAAGVLLWSALLLAGPAWFTAAWRLPYVLGMWAVSLVLSQVFIWSGHAYYAGYTLDDQRAGGGVMLVESSFVMLGAVVWLLLRVFAESEARQRLLDGV
jgi:cytochrome c oxidase assembly factor CtaG